MLGDKTIHATHAEVDTPQYGPMLKTQCGKDDDHRVFSIVPYDFLRLLDCCSHDVDRPLCCECAKVLTGTRKAFKSDGGLIPASP